MYLYTLVNPLPGFVLRKNKRKLFCSEVKKQHMNWGKWFSIVIQYVNTFRVLIMNWAGQKKKVCNPLCYEASWFCQVSILHVLLYFCKNLHYPPGCWSNKAIGRGICVFRKVMLRNKVTSCTICSFAWSNSSVIIWPQAGKEATWVQK